MNGNPRPSRLIQKITLSKSSTLISLWCTAAALESFFAVVLMVSIPRDPNNAFLLGLSTSRWILLVGLLGSLILFGFMAYNLWRNNNVGDWFLTFLTATAVRKTSFIFVVVISFFGFIVISQLFHLANVVVDPFVQGSLYPNVTAFSLVALWDSQMGRNFWSKNTALLVFFLFDRTGYLPLNHPNRHRVNPR